MIIGKQYIKEVALDCGFKLKEQPDGSIDLNPYVYTFADKLIKQTHIELLADFKGELVNINSQINDLFQNVNKSMMNVRKIKVYFWGTNNE